MTLQDSETSGSSTENLPTAPRWLGILVGIVLVLPAVFLLGAGIALPLFSAGKHLVLALVLSVASLAGAALCFLIAWRLVVNRSRTDGGLVSPWFLRGAAVLFAALPLVALATGSWRSMKVKPELIALQMLTYFAGAIVLARLARSREASGGGGGADRPASGKRGA